MAGGYWFGKENDVSLFPANSQPTATEPGADPITPSIPGEDTPVQGQCEGNCAQQRDQCFQEFGANSIYCGNQYQECMQQCADVGEGPGTEPPGTTTGQGCQGGYPASSSTITTESSQMYLDDEWGQGGWMRAGNWAAHMYYHPQYGLHPVETVGAHVEQGIEPAPNNGGSVCPKGVRQKIINGEYWCCPETDTGTTGKTALGEFKWPAEMQNFYNMLIGRGTDMLNMPLGITPEEEAAMFGKDFEKVKGQEGGMQNDLTSWLQTMGALGTGTELEQRGKVSRGIQENISDLMRDLLIYGSERKKSDLLDYTGAASGLFGQGMNYNQIQEAINAARRGESDRALMLLLQMWGGLKY